MTNQQKIKKLFSLLDEIAAYNRCVNKVQFDMECCAPPEGIDQAGDDMALVGKHIYKLSHAKSFTKLVCELHEDSEGLTPLEKKAIEYLYEDYGKEKNVTPKFSYERDVARSKAYGAWMNAKKESDFSKFRDSLNSVIDVSRRSVELYEDKKATPYDTMLNDFEKGGSIEQLDAFFSALKERIVPLVKRIQTEGKPIRDDFLTRPLDIPSQEKMSRYLLKLEGLRESALCLMTTEHPFTDNYGSHDVRVTTHYYENNFISNIFSVLHEGGHALFMQNEPEEFEKNHVDNRMSNGMHECISRFYENIVGRSEAFIRYVYPEIRKLSGDVLNDVSEREFYEAINIAKPILNRCDSDELTYCLHIMVRYELEKAFVNGEITVDEIPALWNRKYREYLGLDVPDDAQGCLQDVHWTFAYGYFPSYALGNAYGAQILRTMEKDFDVNAAMEKGEMDKILGWMREHVFSIASVSTPDEWIRAITGESLNVKYYLDYLEDKFTKLYQLK